MYRIGEETYDCRPLLVVDYRVLCHKVFHLVESQVENGVSGQSYIKSLWSILLNAGPQFVDCTEASVIVVDDCKPYWRTELFPEYKGGRKEKSDRFYSVADIGLSYITSPKAKWLYLVKQGYEADDWAGAIVAAKRAAQAAVRHCELGITKVSAKDLFVAERPIVLWTVDTDWLQLAGEGVYWANTGPWEPRLRYVKETVAYAKKSRTLAKQDIVHPHQIVDVKMKFGDKSDNLPPGTPRHMIDLINIPAKYNLRNQTEWSLVAKWITRDEPSMMVNHFEKARDFLLRNGLGFPN